MAESTTDLVVRLSAEQDRLRKDLNKAERKLKRFGSTSDRVLGKLGGVMAGVFATDQILQFGKEVFNVTAEFQKFSAVLTNTLGSESRAQKSLNTIREFAAKTPFAVNELTDSFIKLANQGFVANIKQMRQLGDLASSVGKSYDQLAEAVIDAQVGEFERLKEFGIRASKQGKKVEFTFKGVKKTVDFTSKSIQDYILSLGDVQGVSGSMAAISGTLEGKVSNLGDAMDNLKLSLGQIVEGPGKGFLDWLINVTNESTGLINLFTRDDMMSGFQKMLVAFGSVSAAMSGNLTFFENLKELSKLQEFFDKREAKLTDLRSAEAEYEESLKKQAQAAKEAAKAQAKLAAEEAKRIEKLQELATKLPTTGKSAGGVNLGISGINLFGASGEIYKQADAYFAQLEKKIQEYQQRYKQNLAELNAIVESGLENAIATFVATAATGQMDNAFAGLLNVVGQGLQSLGKALIAFGVSMEAFKKAFANPYVAIGAGVAAIAAGAIVSQRASSLASVGNGVGGGSGGSTGPSRMQQPFNIPSEIRLRASGNDLVGVINITNRQNNRRSG